MAQIKTLHFPNTPAGQKNKNETLAYEIGAGWKIVSETITSGKFKGGDACCLFLICAPCAFLAGSTDGTINVTLQHEGNAPTSTTNYSIDGSKSIGGVPGRSITFGEGIFALLCLLSVLSVAVGIYDLFTHFVMGLRGIIFGVLLSPLTLPLLGKVMKKRLNTSRAKWIQAAICGLFIILTVYAFPNSDGPAMAQSSATAVQQQSTESSKSVCEFLAQSAAVVYMYCPSEAKPEDIAAMANATKEKYKFKILVQYALYSDKKKAPRNAKQMEKMSDRDFESIKMGFIFFNWHTNHKEYQCRRNGKKKFDDCSDLLKW